LVSRPCWCSISTGLLSLLTFCVSISFQLDYCDSGRGNDGVCRISCALNQDNSKSEKTDYLLAIETNSLANYDQRSVVCHSYFTSDYLPFAYFAEYFTRFLWIVLFCFVSQWPNYQANKA
jgi:hypothetical protein